MIGTVKILALLTAHQCFFIQNLVMLYISHFTFQLLSEVYKVTLLLLALGLDKTV
jgi:hypothetical protein